MTEPLERRLHAAVERTAALARELGYDELAEKVDAGTSRSSANTVTVVVVGETKRGKSSLVNALIGVRDLLPVDADVATSCHLSVQHGDVEHAIVYDAEHPDGVQIAVADIAEYASVEGNRDPDDDDLLLHEGVSAVAVHLDHPLLRRGLMLVDTPGVGGLEAGHTEITLATLRRADALLFVVDPDSPLKAPELRFLERATERIATVIFVMTKVDLYPGWAKIIDDNRELISRHAPTFAGAPWAPVSSELRLHALASGADDDDERSGFTELERLLGEQVIERASVLQLANVLQSAASTLHAMTSAEETRIRAASGDPSLIDELEAKQARLQELAQANATWRRESGDAFRQLEIELQRDLQRRLREFRRDAEDAIAAGGAQLADTLQRDAPASLQAIWIEQTTRLEQDIASLVLGLTTVLQAEGVDALTFDLDFPEALAAVPPINQAQPATSATEHLPAALMGFGGASVGATALGALGMAFPPLLIAGAGAGLAYFIFGDRSQRDVRQRTQNELRRWIGRVYEDAAQEMGGHLRQALAKAPRVTEEFFTQRLQSRTHELEQEIGDCKQRVRADQAERARVQADAQARLRQIDEVTQVTSELFGAIEDQHAREAASV